MHRLAPLLLVVLFLFPIKATIAEVITGAGPGGGPIVKVFAGTTGAEIDAFDAFSPSFMGGVRVAAGDVNNDDVADIVAGAGGGAGGHVKVFDGATNAEVRSFFAYPAFSGGVFVATGDINNDGWDDIITGADASGSAHVKAFSGETGAELRSFFAYPGFLGGVRVAAGDVNNDGVVDIVTGAGPGAAAHVKVFDGVTNAEVRSFFAYPAFMGGVFVASGDLDGDSFADIVTGVDEGGGSHVKAFSGQTGSELLSFLAFEPTFSGGVRVAVGDLNGDGMAEIVAGAGPGAGPHVKVFSGQTGAELDDYFAYGRGFAGGVYVAAAPVPEPAGVLVAALSLAAIICWARQGAPVRSLREFSSL
jgi:hypothetical protein